MTAEPDTAALQDRVRRLEAELDAVRRALEPARDLPTRAFDALEVDVGGAPWLVPIAPIREVLPRMALAPIPDAPPWVAGGFGFNGKTVPVVDLGARLYQLPRASQVDGFVLFLECPAWIGVLVEGVGRVIRAAPNDIAPPPAGLAVSTLLRAIVTVEGRAASLLSVDHLTSEVDRGER